MTCMIEKSTDKPYFILGTEATRNAVEAWSVARLLFEPKDWLLEMRNSLNAEIRHIEPSPDMGLYALYTSAEAGYFDLENILLYNVGTGAFTNLCKNSLCFERRVSAVAKLPQYIDNMRHHYYYSMISSTDEPRFWKEEKLLARWNNIKFNSLRTTIKPHTVWDAIKNGKVEVFEKVEPYSFLGLNIKIQSPKDKKVNLAAVIKPLLDGIISAFHEQNGSPDIVSTNRLATLLGKPPREIEKMLCNSQAAVLGKRNLIHPFREGIQWNPADDLCMAVKVTLEDSLAGQEWQMSGELFTVKEHNS